MKTRIKLILHAAYAAAFAGTVWLAWKASGPDEISSAGRVMTASGPAGLKEAYASTAVAADLLEPAALDRADPMSARRRLLQALASGTAETRLRAVEIAASKPLEVAAEVLGEAAASHDPQVRREAWSRLSGHIAPVLQLACVKAMASPARDALLDALDQAETLMPRRLLLDTLLASNATVSEVQMPVLAARAAWWIQEGGAEPPQFTQHESAVRWWQDNRHHYDEHLLRLPAG